MAERKPPVRKPPVPNGWAHLQITGVHVPVPAGAKTHAWHRVALPVEASKRDRYLREWLQKRKCDVADSIPSKFFVWSYIEDELSVSTSYLVEDKQPTTKPEHPLNCKDEYALVFTPVEWYLKQHCSTLRCSHPRFDENGNVFEWFVVKVGGEEKNVRHQHADPIPNEPERVPPWFGNTQLKKLIEQKSTSTFWMQYQQQTVALLWPTGCSTKPLVTASPHKNGDSIHITVKPPRGDQIHVYVQDHGKGSNHAKDAALEWRGLWLKVAADTNKGGTRSGTTACVRVGPRGIPLNVWLSEEKDRAKQRQARKQPEATNEKGDEEPEGKEGEEERVST